MSEALDFAWFPVAGAGDLVERHIFAGELHNVELALWRDDDGCVNAWDNRCCHRGARLTMGVNTGHRVRCQYHGWQYRSGDGQCIVLPAASQTPPPTSVCAHTFAAVERNDLVWVNLNLPAGSPARPTPHDWLIAAPTADRTQRALQSFVLHADAETVLTGVQRYPAFDSGLSADPSVALRRSQRAVRLSWSEDGQAIQLHLLLQPARTDKTIVHAVLEARTDAMALAQWPVRHQTAMKRLRHRLIDEGRVSDFPLSTSDDAHVQPPPQPKTRRRGSERLLKARVTRVTEAAQDIRSFELEPEDPGDIGALADFIAGAHIDVLTPAGMLRQYSIVSAPGEINAGSAHRFRGVTIAVKREPDSRGGSASMHEQVRDGAIIEISRPKNHFRLANSGGALFLAAGIGVTPLLSMAGQMAATRRPYALHYFSRSAAHVAFGERLAALQDVHSHLGLSPEETLATIETVLAAMDPQMDVYVCGPRPFLDAIVGAAQKAGLSADRVHFELFSNTVSHQGDQPFKVRLARSGIELNVAAGQSLSQVLADHGIPIETSCEQGVCGTCMVAVLEGTPQHRDVYLSEDEKRAGHCMQACVSRSASEWLVLDL